jgi:hypothetical protein
MPVYMDRHYVEGATRHALADAHQRDMALQDKYHVKFLTYWFDELRCTAFCLVEAPNRETIERATSSRLSPQRGRGRLAWWRPSW